MNYIVILKCSKCLILEIVSISLLKSYCTSKTVYKVTFPQEKHCIKYSLSISENLEYAKIEITRSERPMSLVRMEKRKKGFPLLRLFKYFLC